MGVELHNPITNDSEPPPPRPSPPPSGSRLRKSRPAPEAAWPEAHPSTTSRRPSPSAHQNQPEVELAWRTSRARHLESDTRRFGNLPIRVTLTELRYNSLASSLRGSRAGDRRRLVHHFRSQNHR